MTEMEQRYFQIEKEALALVWVCEKFEDYVLGKEIQLETDHKPLVPLLGKMHLDSLPPRILRFRLQLKRFSYSIVHVPGKELYTADTLSRAPLPSSGKPEHDYIEQFVVTVVSTLPANADRLQEYHTAQPNDADCAQLIQLCRNGWPQRKQQVPVHVRPYWSIRGELTIMRIFFFLVSELWSLKASKRRHCKRSTKATRASQSVH